MWYLPAAILLPPGWAFLVPAPLAAFARWRVRRIPGYWRVITGACLGLSYGAASLAFHAIDALVDHALKPGTMGWVLTVAASGVLRWVISSALVLIAARGVDSQMRLRPLLRIGDLVSSDLAELCIGILVTFGAAASPWYAILAVPFVMPLHRSRQHAQLARTARTDAKTGLLNAAAWQQAASAEITRAARTRRPLAMAMVDIDHFKAVNDTYGHLAGDRVLAAVADILTTHLRSYDAAGRFGGEEFALLLPDTTDAAARQIAERLRVKIAATPVLATTRGAVRGGVTVSIGVAALRPHCRTAEELIAAADSALYAAKRAGRDRVRIADPVPGPAAGSDAD